MKRMTTAMVFAAAVLVAVPVAVHAADVSVSDSDPDIFFDDTNVTGAQPHEFTISTDLVPQTFAVTQVDGAGMPVPAFLVDRNAALNTLVVGASGSVGIGTATPFGPLHILSTFPFLSLDNGAQAWSLASDNASFGIGKVLEARYPFLIGENAPGSSLTINDIGDVSVGVPSQATTALSVTRADGTAKLRVAEDLVPANPLVPQTMFELGRFGAIRFDLVDQSSGNTWVFQNRLTFDITLAGTGVQEFKLDGGGNLTISGALLQQSDANSKDGFEPLSGQFVLERLRGLPISTWHYKADTERKVHVGATAQDFYTSFPLGRSHASIAPLDVASIAVAGVKELDRLGRQASERLAKVENTVEAKDSEIASLRHRVDELESTVQQLMSMLRHAQR
ncbi:MAG: tail fiber domain-containing protein [Pseudomonadales bacterium]